MEKVKVIFRKTKDGEIIAFFPTLRANRKNIMSYMHVGQHGEASFEFYKTDTKKAEKEEYKSLLEELRNIYNDCTLVVCQRLYYMDLCRYAWY